MRLHPAIIAIALTAMVLPAGCARTGAFTGRMPGLGKPSVPPAATADAASAEKQVTPKESAKAESEPPAETSTAETAEKSAEEPKTPAAPEVEEKAATPADDQDAGEASSKTAEATTESPADDSDAPPQTLDAATLMMMDEHLKSVPFEERRQLYEDWKALDAATIRERIRQREADASADSPPESDFNPFLDPSADSNAPAEAGVSSDSKLVDPEIAPAGFEVAEAEDGQRNRPVPLMDGLISEGSEAPPEEYDPAPDPDADWNQQLELLIPVAVARAETTRALFLESQSTASEAEDDEKVDDALRRNYIASQVDLRLLYLMAGQRGRALQAIPDLTPAEQEFWRGVLWSIASYFDAESIPDRSERVAQTIEQLRTAISKLQGEAKLSLRNVAFCRKITSFGNFERFEEQTYEPGQKVLLYGEIVNYKSVPRATDGLYETKLKSTIEILKDGEPEPLQRIEFEPTVDLCRSHRQDYFHSYELKLPADLAPGPHVLKLTVEDIQGGDVAVYALNFTIE